MVDVSDLFDLLITYNGICCDSQMETTQQFPFHLSMMSFVFRMAKDSPKRLPIGN